MNSGKIRLMIFHSLFIIIFSRLFFVCSFVRALNSSTSKADCLFHEIIQHTSNTVNQTTKIPCSICGKAFKKRSLRCHLRQHTNERNFKCDLCAALFARRSNLKDHVVRVHCSNKSEGTKKEKQNSEPKFSCSVCGKSFLTR